MPCTARLVHLQILLPGANSLASIADNDFEVQYRPNTMGVGIACHEYPYSCNYVWHNNIINNKHLLYL